MIPAEARAKIAEQSGLSPDQLREELCTKLTELMAGHSGAYTVSYSYDDQGRPTIMRRRVFNRRRRSKPRTTNTGDVPSEITRSKPRAEEEGRSPLAGMLPYSEVRIPTNTMTAKTGLRKQCHIGPALMRPCKHQAPLKER
jgi:hypothetical protein